MSQRITIRLEDDLYDRLLLFARGRSQGHVPDVSAIVREALAQYLQPHERQTDRQTSARQIVRRDTTLS